MIFHWIMKLIRFMFWLVIPPPKETLARIDPNLPCPVCGATKGRLRCVAKELAGATPGQPGLTAIFCQHACAVCAARFFEKPVAAVTPQHVYPGVPRDDQEKAEDLEVALQPRREPDVGLTL